MNEKLMSTAKTGDTVAKIVGAVLQVFAIIFAIFAVLVLILGEKMFEAGSLSLDLDFIKLHLSSQYQTVTGMMKLYTAASLVAAAVSFAVVSWGCVLLRKILAPMKEGRPFDSEVPGILKQAAWVVLVGGGVVQLLGVAGRFFATKAYPLDMVFTSAAIRDWEVNITVDWTFVQIFFVLMLLSHVFSYGVRLQQESDETL